VTFEFEPPCTSREQTLRNTAVRCSTMLQSDGCHDVAVVSHKGRPRCSLCLTSGNSIDIDQIYTKFGKYEGALTMRTHITHVLSSCCSALRQIRSIMPSLSSHALNALVTSLVHSRLDYCNAVFAGLPACDIQRLQAVLNTAVRLVAGSSRRDQAFSLLHDRHWLPVKQRVEYKLCMMVHRCLYGDAPY